jgi:hypothetical protein
MPKSDAERRKAADQRKRDSGQVRVSVWVPLERKPDLIEIAKKMCFKEN